MSCLVIASFILESCVSATGVSSAGWSHAIPGSSPHASSDLIDVSSNLGVVKATKQYNSDFKIINIEDAHASIDAQKKIAELLNDLVARYDLNVIGLEGSEGVVNTALLSAFPEKNAKKQVAEVMLKNTQINAGEFFKIFYDGSNVELFGIEDASLYSSNIKAYQNLISIQTSVQGELTAISEQLKQLRPRIFDSKTLKFIEAQEAFEEGDLDFSEYWKVAQSFVSELKLNLSDFANVGKLATASSLEDRVDFEKANEERDQLFRIIKETTDNQTLNHLTELNLLFKKGEVAPGAFHSRLAQVAEANSINPADYPNLILFTQYALLYESIDLMEIFGELSDLNSIIFKKTGKTEEQEKFWDLEKSIRIFSHFLEAKISSSDKRYFQNHPSKFKIEFLEKTLSDLTRRHKVVARVIDWNSLEKSLSNSVDFYRDVEARDQAMYENLIKRMKEKGVRVACLVAGGFHSEGLSELMSRGQISHVVVMPSFERNEGDRPYLTVITDKGSYLDKTLRVKTQLESVAMLTASAVNSGLNIKDFQPKYAEAFWNQSVLSDSSLKNSDWTDHVKENRFRLAGGVRYGILVENESPKIISYNELSVQEATEILSDQQDDRFESDYMNSASGHLSLGQDLRKEFIQALIESAEEFKVKIAMASTISRLRKTWKTEWRKYYKAQLRKKHLSLSAETDKAIQDQIEKLENEIASVVGQYADGLQSMVATGSSLVGISVAASRLAIENTRVKRVGPGNYEVTLPLYEATATSSEDLVLNMIESINAFSLADVSTENIRADLRKKLEAEFSGENVSDALSVPEVQQALDQKVQQLESDQIGMIFSDSASEVLEAEKSSQKEASEPVWSPPVKPSIWSKAFWSNLFGFNKPVLRDRSWTFGGIDYLESRIVPAVIAPIAVESPINAADVEVFRNDYSDQTEVRILEGAYQNQPNIDDNDWLVFRAHSDTDTSRTIFEAPINQVVNAESGSTFLLFDLEPESQKSDIALSVSVTDGETGSEVTPPHFIASGISVNYSGPSLPPTAQVFNENNFDIVHKDESNDLTVVFNGVDLDRNVQDITRHVANVDTALAEDYGPNLQNRVEDLAGLLFFATDDDSVEKIGPEVMVPFKEIQTARRNGAESIVVTLADIPLTNSPYDVHVKLIGSGLQAHSSTLQIADDVIIKKDTPSIQTFSGLPGAFQVTADPVGSGNLVFSTDTASVQTFVANASNIPTEAVSDSAIRFVLTGFTDSAGSKTDLNSQITILPVSDIMSTTDTSSVFTYHANDIGTYELSAHVVAPGWKPSKPAYIGTASVTKFDIDSDAVTAELNRSAQAALAVHNEFLKLDASDREQFTVASTAINPVLNFNDFTNNKEAIAQSISSLLDVNDPTVDVKVLVEGYVKVGSIYSSYQNTLNPAERASADWILSKLGHQLGLNINLADGLQQNSAQQDIQGLLDTGITSEGLVVSALVREHLKTAEPDSVNDIALIQSIAIQVFELDATLEEVGRDFFAARYLIPTAEQVLTNKVYVNILIRFAQNSGGAIISSSGANLEFRPFSGGGGSALGSPVIIFGIDQTIHYPEDRQSSEIYRPIDRLPGLVAEGDLNGQIIEVQPLNPGDPITYKLRIEKGAISGEVEIEGIKGEHDIRSTINTIEHYFVTVLNIYKDGELVSSRLLIIDVDPVTGELKVVGDISGDVSEFVPRLEYDEQGNLIAIHFSVGGKDHMFLVRQHQRNVIPEVEPPAEIDVDALLNDLSSAKPTVTPEVAIAPKSEIAEPSEEAVGVIGEDEGMAKKSAGPDLEDQAVEEEQDESLTTSIVAFVIAAIASVVARLFLKKKKSQQDDSQTGNRLIRYLKGFFGLSVLLLALSSESIFSNQLIAQELPQAVAVDLEVESKRLVSDIRTVQSQEKSVYQSYLKAKEALELNEEGYRYTQNKFMSLMQVSWNAVGGIRNESEVNDSIRDEQGRLLVRRLGLYRFPQGSGGDWSKIQRNEYFAVGSPSPSGEQSRIIQQFRTAGELPEAVRVALSDSPAPYYSPSGVGFARYFDGLLADESGVPQVGFIFRGRKSDGSLKIETVPAAWKNEHPTEFARIEKFGISAPAFVEATVITRERYQKLKAAEEKYPDLGISAYYDSDRKLYYEVSSGKDGRWNRLGSFFLKTSEGIDFSLQLIRGTQSTFGGINEDAHLAAEEMELLALKGGVIRARADVFDRSSGGLAPLQVVVWSNDEKSENYRLIQEVLEKQRQEKFRLIALLVEAQRRKDAVEEERIMKLLTYLSEQGWWLDGDGYMYTIWTPLTTISEEQKELTTGIEELVRRLQSLKENKARLLNRFNEIKNQLNKGARLAVWQILQQSKSAPDGVTSLLILPGLFAGISIAKSARPKSVIVSSEVDDIKIDLSGFARQVSSGEKLLLIGNLSTPGLSSVDAVEVAQKFISRIKVSTQGLSSEESIKILIMLDQKGIDQPTDFVNTIRSSILDSNKDDIRVVVTDAVVATAYAEADNLNAQPVLVELNEQQTARELDAKILSAYELHLGRQSERLDAISRSVFRDIEKTFEDISDDRLREQAIARHKFEFSTLILSDFGVFSSATAQFFQDRNNLRDDVARAFVTSVPITNAPTALTAVLDYTTFRQLESLDSTLSGQEIQQRMLKEQAGTESRIVWLFEKESDRQEALQRNDLSLDIRNSFVSTEKETAGIMSDAETAGIVIAPGEEAIVIQLTAGQGSERKLERSIESDVYVLEVEADLKTSSTGFFLLRGFDVAVLKERVRTEAIPGIQVLFDQNGRMSIRLKAVRIDWESIMSTLRKSITAVGSSA